MAKLPEKIFVVAKVDHYNPQLPPPIPFGFLNAFEPNKSTWASKQNTQMKWAYASWGLQFVERNGVWWQFGTRNVWDGTKHRQEPVDEPLKFQPQTWDNTPLPGFKIEKSVTRYSTSNKVWRIIDPRQVEFEISTAVLEQIIQDATILKGGVIDAKCAWMSNKNLVVVP
jgi:hypothetical protein